MRKSVQQHIGTAGLSALLSCCLPMALAAQDAVFAPPEGCTAYLTVQHRDCRVEHHYTCTDAGTDRFREVFTDEGPVYQSRIDAQAQWINSRELPNGGLTETLLPARDHASMDTLLETGTDTMDFEQRTPDGRLQRITGEDRIVDRNVVIDGEPLYRTEFVVNFLAPDGGVMGTYTGSEYVSPVHRRFFAGRGKAVFDGVETSFDRTPKEFIYPGEPGFGTLEPVYDCGVMMSALEIMPSAGVSGVAR